MVPQPLPYLGRVIELAHLVAVISDQLQQGKGFSWGESESFKRKIASLTLPYFTAMCCEFPDLSNENVC